MAYLTRHELPSQQRPAIDRIDRSPPVILVLESEAGPFVETLRRAIQKTDAESLVATSAASGQAAIGRLAFTAVVASEEYRQFAQSLKVPAVIYQDDANVRTIMRELRRCLAS